MLKGSEKKVPVTILTGFLGSGKTTLLNWILQKQHGRRIAVIENEFGEVGVDDALVQRSIGTKEDVIIMNNGCICCTVRGDLIEAFKQLKPKLADIDAVVIETTGLADPAPVCQTFYMDKDVESVAYLDAVVTVVDAKHIVQHLDEEKPEGVENESVEQVAFADKIILNKIDLVDAETLALVEQKLKSLNKFAKIIKAELKKESVPLDEILGIDAFSLDRILEMDPEFLKDQEHEHDQRVTSIGFMFEADIALSYLQVWIKKFIQVYGNDLFRYKGVLSVKGIDRKFVFQGVHMMFDGDFTEEWRADEKRENRMVFIGKNLAKDEIKKDFMACVAKPLRFKIGDAVQCNVEEGYVAGTIIRTWDEGNPYRVRLSTLEDVWAPLDIDEFIKKA